MVPLVLWPCERDSASANWCLVPGRHWSSMSYCISRSAHRWYFADRAWLLNSQVKAAQSVMRVNGVPEGMTRICQPPKAPPGIPDQSVTFFHRFSTNGGLHTLEFSRPFPGLD